MKNCIVLGQALLNFEANEDFIQEAISDYINCPSCDDCKYDGVNNEVCIECKIKWLMDEWK